MSKHKKMEMQEVRQDKLECWDMKWKILMVCVVLLLIGISFAWSNTIYDVDTIGDRTAPGYGVTYYNNITYFVYPNGLNITRSTSL